MKAELDSIFEEYPLELRRLRRDDPKASHPDVLYLTQGNDSTYHILLPPMFYCLEHYRDPKELFNVKWPMRVNTKLNQGSSIS